MIFIDYISKSISINYHDHCLHWKCHLQIQILDNDSRALFRKQMSYMNILEWNFLIRISGSWGWDIAMSCLINVTLKHHRQPCTEMRSFSSCLFLLSLNNFFFIIIGLRLVPDERGPNKYDWDKLSSSIDWQRRTNQTQGRGLVPPFFH